MNGGSGISIGGVRILRVITNTAISIKTIYPQLDDVCHVQNGPIEDPTMKPGVMP